LEYKRAWAGYLRRQRYIDSIHLALIISRELLGALGVAKDFAQNAQIACVLFGRLKIYIHHGNINCFDRRAILLSIAALHHHQVRLRADKLFHAGIALEPCLFGIVWVQQGNKIDIALCEILKSDYTLTRLGEHIHRIQHHKGGFARHHNALWKGIECYRAPQSICKGQCRAGFRWQLGRGLGNWLRHG